MSVIDIWEIKKEWVFFLRNNDIFTTTVRNVTTDSDTGTFASDSSHLINRANVKNIRSITVDGNPLSYGSEYQVDLDYDDSGTTKCRLTFTSVQTGDYVISYDYGSDKIFPDFPREDLTLSSFPRIGSDVVSAPSELYSFDGDQLAVVNLTTTVYVDNIEQLNNYITAIATAVNNNRKNFYYVGKFVRKVAIGPVLKIPEEVSQDKIFQQNIDTQGLLNFER